MIDLEFIEITNRWISDTQVKIKVEIALANQQASTLKELVKSYEIQLDSMFNPNLDKQVNRIFSFEFY
jgi:hypothetical protein